MALTGTATTAQRNQSTSVASKLIFSGAEAKSQSSPVEASVGKLAFVVSESGSQQHQTEVVSSKETFSGTESASQQHQIGAVTGKQTFTSSEAAAQSTQTLLGFDQEVFGGRVANSQFSESTAGQGILRFNGAGTSSQQKAAAASGSQTFTGSVAEDQHSQTVVAFDVLPPVNGVISTTQVLQTVAVLGSGPSAFTSGINVGAFGSYAAVEENQQAHVTVYQREQVVSASGTVLLATRIEGHVESRRSMSRNVVGIGEMIDVELEEVTCLLAAM